MLTLQELSAERILYFQAIAAALQESASLGACATSVVEACRSAMGAQAGALYLLSEDGSALELLGADGYPPEEIDSRRTLPIESPLPEAQAVRENHALFLRSFSPSGSPLGLNGNGARAAVLLEVEGETVGVLALAFDQEHDFPDEERAFLTAVAQQCALAVERADLRAEVQRRRDEARLLRAESEAARQWLTYLAEATNAFAGTTGVVIPDRDRPLDAITRLAVSRVADWAATYLMDDAGMPQRQIISHRDPAEERRLRRTLAAHTIQANSGHPIYTALLTGRTQYGTFTAGDILPEGQEFSPAVWRLFQDLSLRSYVCVPLVARGRTLGVVGFYRNIGASQESFSREEVTWCEEVCQWTALAVDNAQLYAEMRREMEERRRAEAENARLLQEAERTAERQRAFLRDVLSSVTEGRLLLCDRPEHLPALLEPVGPPLPLEPRLLRLVRRQAEEAGALCEMPAYRTMDLVMAVGEAAMNAVVHAGGGTATLCVDSDAGVAQVWIVDKGQGIDLTRLPRATLERGYTTKGTLGHGFHMMLQTVDRVYVLTGPEGTTVVLEVERNAPEPDWLQQW